MVSSSIKQPQFASSQPITLMLADLIQVSFPVEERGHSTRRFDAAPMTYRPDTEGEFSFEISRIAPREERGPHHCGSAFLRVPGILHFGRRPRHVRRHAWL